ncbi:MAG: hypothetical protein IJI46_01515 [Erysipelotrichaceae bacterium]|nr:hypothetical protein [Erysipelotrichaceae bacterium]
MNIDIERVKEIQEELRALDQSDVLFIEENGERRYAMMNIELYEQLEDIMTMLNGPAHASVRIAGPEEIDLTYDEYEMIKRQIMDAVERTFMPKPEKLN